MCTKNKLFHFRNVLLDTSRQQVRLPRNFKNNYFIEQLWTATRQKYVKWQKISAQGEACVLSKPNIHENGCIIKDTRKEIEEK